MKFVGTLQMHLMEYLHENMNCPKMTDDWDVYLHSYRIKVISNECA